MPQSLDNILIHLVFSTKGRIPWLDLSIASELHAYLASLVRNAGCECPRIGGVADHVHLAVRLSRTISIAALVMQLKALSSKWLKGQSPRLSNFAWQRGYAAFSVGPADLAALSAYLDNQQEHHKTRNFQDEYRALLTKCGIPYDERYIWD